MQNGDIVLTPNENSKSYNIGIIIGVYEYKAEAPEHFSSTKYLHHEFV